MGSHRGGDCGGDGGRAPDASHGATGQLHGYGVVRYNHSVAMIGDSHARRLAAVERPTAKVYGCLQIGTRATSDGARGGLGSELRGGCVLSAPSHHHRRGAYQARLPGDRLRGKRSAGEACQSSCLLRFFIS